MQIRLQPWSLYPWFGVLLFLFGASTARATTLITSLTAQPTVVSPGETVVFHMRVETEAYSLSGAKTITLYRNGVSIYREEDPAYLDGQSVANVGYFEDRFEISPDAYRLPGKYRLLVSLSGTAHYSYLDVAPIGTQAETTFQVQEVPVKVSPSQLNLQGVPGETVQGSFQVIAGTDPFYLSANQGTLDQSSVELNQAVTYRFAIPSDAAPGVSFSDSIQIQPAAGTAIRLPVTIQVNQPPVQDIQVEPASLQLQGKAGNTPWANFKIRSGTPPFRLSSATPDRAGFSTDAPGLNETITYRYRIPDTAAGQSLQDLITVKGADGAQATVPVTIRVEKEESEGPTQEEIDHAMESIARTPPQRSVAAAISTICPKGVALDRLQRDCDQVVSAALQNNQTQASHALSQVTADQASTSVDAAQTSVQAQFRNLSTRIAALRGGITGLSLRGLTVNLDGENLPIAQILEGLGGAAGDEVLSFGRWGIFINGSYSAGDRDRTQNAAGFDTNAVSITLGADYRFQENLIGGLAFGYTSNNTDLDSNGGSLDIDAYHLSLYGTYYQDNGFYLDGIFSYGWDDYDQRRRIRYEINSIRVNQTAFADFKGHQWSASLGGGYSLSRGPWSFGPTARLEYVQTDVDGYQERMSNPTADGGGWAVRIQDQDVTFFHSQLGAEVAYAISTSWGVLQPSAHLEWVHEFEDGGDNVVGHFVQDTSRTQFSLPTDRNDKDYYNLRIGVSAQFAKGRSAFLYYRKLFGYSDLNAYTIGGGLRLEF